MSDTQDNKSTGSAVLDFDIPPTHHVILGGDNWENLDDPNLITMTEIALKWAKTLLLLMSWVCSTVACSNRICYTIVT